MRFDGRDVLKVSPGKETWVGAKQVVRRLGPGGRLGGDLLALAEEPVPAGGRGLLEPVLQGGELVRAHPSLLELREHCAAELRSLPDGLRELRDGAAYPVTPSDALRARQEAAGGRTADGQTVRRSDGRMLQ